MANGRRGNGVGGVHIRPCGVFHLIVGGQGYGGGLQSDGWLNRGGQRDKAEGEKKALHGRFSIFVASTVSDGFNAGAHISPGFQFMASGWASPLVLVRGWRWPTGPTWARPPAR
jgi:hypothetical protein